MNKITSVRPIYGASISNISSAGIEPIFVQQYQGIYRKFRPALSRISKIDRVRLKLL